MTHEQYCTATALRDFLHLADGFLLEFGITDGEDFVDDEDFGVEVCGDGEAEADGHTTGIALDGCVDIALTAGEADDLVELAGNLLLGHAKDQGVHVNVFPPGELGIKAAAQLQQRRDRAGYGDRALIRGENACDQLQQGGLAGAVPADEAHDGPRLQVKAHPVQGKGGVMLGQVPHFQQRHRRHLQSCEIVYIDYTQSSGAVKGLPACKPGGNPV